MSSAPNANGELFPLFASVERRNAFVASVAFERVERDI